MPLINLLTPHRSGRNSDHFHRAPAAVIGSVAKVNPAEICAMSTNCWTGGVTKVQTFLYLLPKIRRITHFINEKTASFFHFLKMERKKTDFPVFAVTRSWQGKDPKAYYL